MYQESQKHGLFRGAAFHGVGKPPPTLRVERCAHRTVAEITRSWQKFTVGLCQGPYVGPMGGGRFLTSEVPLYHVLFSDMWSKDGLVPTRPGYRSKKLLTTGVPRS